MPEPEPSAHLAKRLLRVASGLTLRLGVLVIAALIYPEPAFAYHVTSGALSLYSDTPFSPGAGRTVLADVESRLKRSPLYDHGVHRIFVTNSAWRRTLAFATGPGAAGVNYYPVTTNVFIRRADIDHDRVMGASGRTADPPRTLAYYAAHEIAHSFTGETRGPLRLWNRTLQPWVREGYADYVGMGRKGEAAELYKRLIAGDPALNPHGSGQYARYRMLVAYYMESRGWTVAQLLDGAPSQAVAEQTLFAHPPVSP